MVYDFFFFWGGPGCCDKIPGKKHSKKNWFWLTNPSTVHHSGEVMTSCSQSSWSHDIFGQTMLLSLSPASQSKIPANEWCRPFGVCFPTSVSTIYGIPHTQVQKLAQSSKFSQKSPVAFLLCDSKLFFQVSHWY